MLDDSGIEDVEISVEGIGRMFKLVQPNCFAVITDSITEAAVRLPLHSRAKYIETSLDREIRSASALLQKALLVKNEKRFLIWKVLQQLGVENAWKPSSMIVRRARRLRAPQLVRILSTCSYTTAHQAIQAIAQIGKVHTAIQGYVDAMDDAWDASELYLNLKSMRSDLDACKRYVG